MFHCFFQKICYKMRHELRKSYQFLRNHKKKKIMQDTRIFILKGKPSTFKMLLAGSQPSCQAFSLLPFAFSADCLLLLDTHGVSKKTTVFSFYNFPIKLCCNVRHYCQITLIFFLFF